MVTGENPLFICAGNVVPWALTVPVRLKIRVIVRKNMRKKLRTGGLITVFTKELRDYIFKPVNTKIPLENPDYSTESE